MHLDNQYRTNMIREFWVKNYLSIRDKQGLDFTTKGPASELVVEVAEGVFLYKLGVLYGSNASGKSNMLMALNEVFRLLVKPETDAETDIKGYIPFELTRTEPTEMYVSFYAKGIRYDYYIRYDRQNILKEMLNYYPNGSKSLFYERTFVGTNMQSDIKFGTSLKLAAKTQESIRELTLHNHSVLSVCRKSALKEDIEALSTLHNCIMTSWHEVDGDNKKGIVETLSDAYADPAKRKFFTQMLQKADLNIVDFHPVMTDRKISVDYRKKIEMEEIPEHLKEALLSTTVQSAAFINKSEKGDFEIPLRLQSKGTQKYILILSALYNMITESHVYCLDELGEDLHADLLFYYLNVFLFNSEQSQLIITSQETTLLSQDLINENRGVVWLVEKNRQTASSEYARADSFGLHKNLSLYNSYRVGRLGAKPELGSIFIDIE